MANLAFPFIEVNDPDIDFGFSNKENFYQALKECPQEFFKDTKYSKLFSQLFFEGGDLSKLKYRTNNSQLRVKQIRYLRSIMVSFEPKHQDKEAVCSWILSLIFDLGEENNGRT